MHPIVNQLLNSGDFLSLSRQNPWTLETVESFAVSHKQSNKQTKVSIIETGIICFEPLSVASEKDIVLSSGIHGNETAPIEICDELVKQILLGESLLPTVLCSFLEI